MLQGNPGGVKRSKLASFLDVDEIPGYIIIEILDETD
jgi:hypothetical protein